MADYRPGDFVLCRAPANPLDERPFNRPGIVAEVTSYAIRVQHLEPMGLVGYLHASDVSPA